MYYDKEQELGNYSFSDDENKLFDELFKLIAYTRDIKNGLGKRFNLFNDLCLE